MTFVGKLLLSIMTQTVLVDCTVCKNKTNGFAHGVIHAVWY